MRPGAPFTVLQVVLLLVIVAWLAFWGYSMVSCWSSGGSVVRGFFGQPVCVQEGAR